jgi:hypothetical protein
VLGKTNRAPHDDEGTNTRSAFFGRRTMKYQCNVSEPRWLPAPGEVARRVAHISRERVIETPASLSYAPTRRARHGIPERLQVQSNHARICWFTGLYLTSVLVFSAFVRVERALLALL